MELSKKKIIVINLDVLEQTGEADIRLRKDVLDKLGRMSHIQRVVLLYSCNEILAKATELFVFAYCRLAVSSVSKDEDFMSYLPYNLRKKELIVSVGEMFDGIDFMSVEDFL